MIVTVTLNPALHVHYKATRVQLGAANNVSGVRYLTGGRGLAVARLLHTFGHEVVAAGLAGGSAGELIRNELARAGVATQFTWIAAESRRVVQVADGAGGHTTSFGEPAPYITTEELGRLAADYRNLLDGATAVVLCGSLPDGLPPETYGSLASYAASAGVPVVLNAGGSALRHGAARGPALVIPESDGTGLPVLAGLESAGAGSVVLPTSRGVRVLAGGREWLAELGPGFRPPDWSAPDTTASFRDGLVAGFVPGIALSWSWPDMLRHALALAASATPAGQPDIDAYERALPGVVITAPGHWPAL
ncbi:MAG: 1-phosphofructokinase family hexose kinase [Streptosporangiaceae bacterium]